MNRLTYLFAMLAVLYGIVNAVVGEGDGPRRPEISLKPPVQAAPQGPTIEIEVGTKGPSTGTAFAVTDDGWWLTARHVADGCDAIWIQTKPGKGWRAQEVHLHPRADLALLRTRSGREPLGFSEKTPARGENGFSMGYPKGNPGEVHVRAMGQARMKSVGRYNINEPVLAWAEVTRRPSNLPALGGLSGGPMLDDQGQVVGVLVASSKRRGRVMTTAQSSIQELLDQFPEAQDSSGSWSGSINGGSFTTQGQTLRRELTIAKVICQVRRKKRRPTF